MQPFDVDGAHNRFVIVFEEFGNFYDNGTNSNKQFETKLWRILFPQWHFTIVLEYGRL